MQTLQIEKSVLQAWPAEVVELCDGWRLRFAHGVTGRANSVWPNRHHGRIPISEKIAQVSLFYQRYGLPPRYQIGPAARPATLDRLLAERGYRAYAPTFVKTISLPAANHSWKTPAGLKIDIADNLAVDWLEFHQAMGGYDDQTLAIRTAIMRRVTAPVAFVSARVAGRIFGIGMGVCTGQMTGIFNVETDPAYRRQGIATAVMRSILTWAAASGTRWSYLQVTRQNQPALALYDKLGFETCYSYYYRIAPAGEG